MFTTAPDLGSVATPDSRWLVLDVLPEVHVSQRPEVPLLVSSVDVRRSTHDDIMALGRDLTDEFVGRVPSWTVARAVARARASLLAAGVRDGLVVAVESMVRAHLGRLAARPRSEEGDR